MDAVEDGGVVLDLKNNSPIMEVAECPGLDLSPIEPVVVAVLLSIDVLELGVVEFVVMFCFAKREHQVKVPLNCLIDLNLNKTFCHFLMVIK